jgi:ATP-dependent Clp protease protease subunit
LTPLNQIRPDVSTICIGLACQYGGFSPQCRQTGQKNEPTQLADHDSPTPRRRPRSATNIEIQAKEILYLKQLLNQHLASHTGKPLDLIAKRIRKRDFFMSAEEALDYGLINQVIDRSPSASNPPQ